MHRPLENLSGWENPIERRYQPEKKPGEFRRFTAQAPRVVQELYRLNHTQQTREFVRQKKREYLSLQKGYMGVWEAMERLNALVDDSDPDTDLSQIEHLLQTAEASRRDGRPRWFILAGLIHDLGKVLYLYGEPQWAVVGDTFPVGCAYSDQIVYHEFFVGNPDAQVPEYQTRLGIYQEGGGLDQVDMSWGHDEYLYHVVKPYLPEESLYVIRYHSFYSAHQEGAYEYLMSAHDKEMFRWVRAFNPYDLYSKSSQRPDADELRPYYEELIAEFLPARLRW